MRPVMQVALVVGLFALEAFGLPALAGTDVGQPAPPLDVEQLDGQPFDLGALRGHVVILNFWASWCLPCRQEMPTLDAFYRRYHAQGLEMLGLSVGSDRSRDRADAREAMQAFSYPAAMLKDAKGNGFDAPSALPLTLVIDGNGIVRAKLTPDQAPITDERLADIVLPLLPGKPANQAQQDPNKAADRP